MGRLYFIVCRDCKEKVTYGKNSEVYGNIGKEELQAKFLFKHENHQLQFVDEHDNTIYEPVVYKEIDA